MFKKYAIKLLVVLAIVGLITGCGGAGKQNAANTDSKATQEKPKQTIVLKGITAWEENNIHSAGFKLFKQKVEELSGGSIKIEYAGGPEAIPAFNQGDAVKNGVVDFADISPAYYNNLVPEGSAFLYSELTPQQERDGGGIALMNEIHAKKMNAIVLGRASGMGISLYTKKPIKSISDFKGKRLRGSAVYIPFIKALGAEAVVMPASEIYTAIERGVIDGIVWPDVGMTDLGLEKQIKYQIFPSYYKVDTVIVMNLDKWKSLSKETQDILSKAALEEESLVDNEFKTYYQNEQSKLKAAGVQPVNLPEQEFQKIANDSAWAWVKANLPEYGTKLAEAFRKK